MLLSSEGTRYKSRRQPLLDKMYLKQTNIFVCIRNSRQLGQWWKLIILSAPAITRWKPETKNCSQPMSSLSKQQWWSEDFIFFVLFIIYVREIIIFYFSFQKLFIPQHNYHKTKYHCTTHPLFYINSRPQEWISYRMSCNVVLVYPRGDCWK